MITDALTYPFRQGGWLMIIVGSAFAFLINIGGNVPLAGLAVTLFGAGYFGSFYLSIISSTILGRDHTPDWLDFTSFLDDIISPFLRLLGLTIISFLPLFLVLIFGQKEQAWVLPAIILAALYGCFYFPMAVLAMLSYGGVLAALPPIVFPAIFRCMPGYILAVVALMLSFFIGALVEEFCGYIPYVGWVLGAAVGLYSLMIQARLIGLLYRQKRDDIGWD